MSTLFSSASLFKISTPICPRKFVNVISQSYNLATSEHSDLQSHKSRVKNQFLVELRLIYLTFTLIPFRPPFWSLWAARFLLPITFPFPSIFPLQFVSPFLSAIVFTGFEFFSAPRAVPRVIDKDFSRYDPVDEDDQDGKSVPFNLEETYDQSFRANGFNGTWRTDQDILYTDNYSGDVRAFNVTSGISKIITLSSITVRHIKA